MYYGWALKNIIKLGKMEYIEHVKQLLKKSLVDFRGIIFGDYIGEQIAIVVDECGFSEIIDEFTKWLQEFNVLRLRQFYEGLIRVFFDKDIRKARELLSRFLDIVDNNDEILYELYNFIKWEYNIIANLISNSLELASKLRKHIDKIIARFDIWHESAIFQAFSKLLDKKRLRYLSKKCIDMFQSAIKEQNNNSEKPYMLLKNLAYIYVSLKSPRILEVIINTLKNSVLDLDKKLYTLVEILEIFSIYRLEETRKILKLIEDIFQKNKTNIVLSYLADAYGIIGTYFDDESMFDKAWETIEKITDTKIRNNTIVHHYTYLAKKGYELKRQDFIERSYSLAIKYSTSDAHDAGAYMAFYGRYTKNPKFIEYALNILKFTDDLYYCIYLDEIIWSAGPIIIERDDLKLLNILLRKWKDLISSNFFMQATMELNKALITLAIRHKSAEFVNKAKNTLKKIRWEKSTAFPSSLFETGDIVIEYLLRICKIQKYDIIDAILS